MDQLVSTSLIEMLNHHLDAEQIKKLDHLFKLYEILELSRLKGAYAHGALDYCLNNGKNVRDYIEEKYGL
jgi:hypothetical protein